MSQENIEIVRAINAAFEAGLNQDDFEAVWDTGLVAADSELLPAPEIEGPVVYRGRDGFVDFMGRWTEDFEEFKVRLERVIEAPGNRVVAFAHQSAVGKGSGVPVDLHYGAVFELQAGVLVRLRLFLDPAQALAAAGLHEQAMPRENVEIVREAWDAYSRGDYDRIAGFHDPHIVVVTLEDGAVYGNDAVLANYKRWNEAWEGAETTLEEVIGQGDRVFVAVRFHARGRASGVAVESRLYEVYTVHQGKVVRIDEYSHRAEALEAAGLSE